MAAQSSYVVLGEIGKAPPIFWSMTTDKRATMVGMGRIEYLMWSGRSTIPAGSCLLQSYFLAHVLMKKGIPVVFQAGSLSWRYAPDGQPHTHFSYQWDPTHPSSVAAVRAGKMPEMHVWLADPITSEIIDPSTGQIKASAEASIPGLRWQEPPPPDFVWGKPNEGGIYTAEMDACLAMLRLLRASRLPDFAEVLAHTNRSFAHLRK